MKSTITMPERLEKKGEARKRPRTQDCIRVQDYKWCYMLRITCCVVIVVIVIVVVGPPDPRYYRHVSIVNSHQRQEKCRQKISTNNLRSK
jgi:hypothetical protein